MKALRKKQAPEQANQAVVPPPQIALMAMHQNRVVDLSTAGLDASAEEQKRCWFVDSGASWHMTTRDDWLHNYQKLTPTIKVLMAAPGKTVEAVGTARILLFLPSKIQVHGSGAGWRSPHPWSRVESLLHRPGLPEGC